MFHLDKDFSKTLNIFNKTFTIPSRLTVIPDTLNIFKTICISFLCSKERFLRNDIYYHKDHEKEQVCEETGSSIFHIFDNTATLGFTDEFFHRRTGSTIRSISRQSNNIPSTCGNTGSPDDRER